MSVTLPSTNGTVYSEYAATNITFARSMVPDANGHYQPQFSAQIPYARVDYLVDASGNKTNIVQRTQTPYVQPAPGVAPVQDPYSGFVSLDHVALAPYLTQTTPDMVFGFISNMADSLIKADLVARGIIAAPAS